MATKIPTDMIVVAASHGCTLLYNQKVQTFKVPEGITLTLVSATRPGIVNVTTTEGVDKVVKSAIKNPDSVLSALKRTEPDLMKSINQQLKDPTMSTDQLTQYIQSRIKDPKSYELAPGDNVAEKIFSRSPYEAMYQAFDYRLNVINMPGRPDLFDLLRNRVSGPTANTRFQASQDGPQIKFSLLLDILVLEGVKNLTFYDLSCSVFQHEDPMYTSNRAARDAAREYTGNMMNQAKATMRSQNMSRYDTRKNKFGGKRKTRRVRGKTNTHRTRRRKAYNGYTKVRSRTVRRH